MTTKERYAGVIKWFQENKPIAETELLIAVILSAQCTDKRVNMITPALFEAFPTPQDLAAATPEEVYTYIKSVSYPNNKSKHLVGMARTLIEQFNGVVPSEIEDLQKLPGVGRKTANVFRVSNRIGLTNHSKTPLETEKTLVKNIPGHLLPIAHHWLILHGRYICMARKPNCLECGIRPYCKYYNHNQKNNAEE